jgi:ribosomal protein S18 acetylase RimI-like enzyme
MTSSSVTIRPATNADLPRLGRLGALLVDAHHEFDPRRFLPVRDRTPTDYAGFLIRQLRDSEAIVLVADEGGDVVGYTYATVEGYDYMSLRGPAGVIQDIIVDPESRQRGIGRLLLDAVVSALAARKVSQIVLSTAQQNVHAQHLFATAGFRPTMIEMTRTL